MIPVSCWSEAESLLVTTCPYQKKLPTSSFQRIPGFGASINKLGNVVHLTDIKKHKSIMFSLTQPFHVDSIVASKELLTMDFFGCNAVFTAAVSLL